MPRRYWSYPAEFQALNVASTAGASLLAFGFLIILVYLVGLAAATARRSDATRGARAATSGTRRRRRRRTTSTCPQVFDHPPHDYDSEGHEPEMQTEVHGGAEVHGNDKGGNNHG